MLLHAIELLDALEKISGSAALNNGTPSSTVIQFIERIESADPTAPDIDEDDTNIGWGHSQFTSGGLTCRSVLQTWSDIGNVQTAYHLLAASLKTGLVARHLCFANKVSVSDSSSYLSDAYLREVVEILWNFRPQVSELYVYVPRIYSLMIVRTQFLLLPLRLRQLWKPLLLAPPTSLHPMAHKH